MCDITITVTAVSFAMKGIPASLPDDRWVARELPANGTTSKIFLLDYRPLWSPGDGH